jgi:Mrp family chromosome partitioning ATPase
MSAVLVTVMGPAGRLDLEVPAEPPVAVVLDALARLLGATEAGDPTGDWSLHPLGGDPLPADESLRAAGVRDGAVLVLADRAASAEPAPRLRQSAVIAVLSAAAGMGRTTVAALLAGALAAGTGELTVAVDADPGTGSLSERLAPDHEVTATDLLALTDHPEQTREELLDFVAWCGPRLGLLATRPRRDRAAPLAERDWRRLLSGLGRHGLTVVLDCPPGLGGPGTRAAVANADQIVLVVEPSPSPASRMVAHALADRGLPVLVVPWSTPPRSEAPGSEAPPLGNQPGDLAGSRPLAHGARGPRAYGAGDPRADEVGGPAAGAISRLPGVAHVIRLLLGRGVGPSAWRDPAVGLPPVGRSPGWLLPVGGSRQCWDQVRRVAEVLVADWVALGLAAPSRRDHAEPMAPTTSR